MNQPPRIVFQSGGRSGLSSYHNDDNWNDDMIEGNQRENDVIIQRIIPTCDNIGNKVDEMIDEDVDDIPGNVNIIDNFTDGVYTPYSPYSISMKNNDLVEAWEKASTQSILHIDKKIRRNFKFDDLFHFESNDLFQRSSYLYHHNPWTDLHLIQIPESLLFVQRIVCINEITRIICRRGISREMIGCLLNIKTIFESNTTNQTQNSMFCRNLRQLEIDDVTYQPSVDFLIHGIRVSQQSLRLPLTNPILHRTTGRLICRAADSGLRRLGEIERDAMYPHILLSVVTGSEGINMSYINPVHRFNDQIKEGIPIDPMNICIEYFLMKICVSYENIKNKTLVYNDKNNKINGIGDGADRYCKTILLGRIIDKYFVSSRQWFVTFNDTMTETFSKHFKPVMGFIRLCVETNVLLPWHLDPCIIEVLISRPLTYEESLHYLEYIDPIVYKNVKNMDPGDFDSFRLLCTGHKSLDHMIREIVINQQVSETEKLLINQFDFGFTENEIKNAVELDAKISEPYELNSGIIKNLFKITDDDPKYKNMWDNLINDLDKNELRSMMILFTGSSNIINRSILLHVNHECVENEQDKNHHIKIKKCDIEIQTCFYTGSIHERIFESQEILNGLKVYFNDHCDFIYN